MSRLVTVKELANELSVHPHTVQGWCRDGLVPHVRIPGRQGYEYRFDLAQVLEWIDAKAEVKRLEQDLVVALNKVAYDPEESPEGRLWARQILGLLAVGNPVALRAISES